MGKQMHDGFGLRNLPAPLGRIRHGLPNSRREQLGFIPEHVSRGGDSSGLAFRIDRGEKYSCSISDLTGGDGKTPGVNIEITDAKDFEALETEAVTSLPRSGGNPSWVLVIGAVLLIMLALLVVALR
jgi:hypothetical protein